MVILMDLVSKIKDYSKKLLGIIKDNYKSYLYILWMALPFILMDVFIMMFGHAINYSNYHVMSTVFFTFTWLVLFIVFPLCFNSKIGKKIYLFFSILFLSMFLVNNVYYSMTRSFFDFSLIESASEGAPYMIEALKNCNVFVYFAFAIVVISIINGYKKYPHFEKNNKELALLVFVLFLTLHLLAPYTLGRANVNLTWSSWRNARNIYNSFNDPNKSMKITGLYEYTVRNFYITFLKSEEQISEEDIEFLNSAYSDGKTHKNKYTGKFKGKNLILIQLEGTDKWLINKEDTPTLYKLMNEGINFNNHYSYYNGGGSTFNSEFAVNTGFITPLSYTRNAYSFNKNDFPNSLANLFRKEGYSINAFHMNDGEYYSRTVNYLNWGYDNYYGLTSIEKYSNYGHYLDRELILNEKFNELMFREDGNFVDYIIAYSGHLPFDNSNPKSVCKLLYDLDIKEREENGEEVEFVQMSEEECTRRQARETDYMVELLIENLKEKKLLDNTIITIFTDHYLYTLEDQSILSNYKNTSNNLINNTPWFIWSSDIKKNKVNKVTSQLNILPTMLNLFGISYNTNLYIAGDALDPKYDGIVFFSDYSWYDGNVYVESGEVTNNKKIKRSKLEEKNEYISYITKKNDLTLKYNYLK